MKKFIAFLLVLATLFSLVGCSDGETEVADPEIDRVWYSEEELKGKNIVFYGDSITAGHSTTGFSYNNSAQSKNSYPYLLTKAYGCGYRNHAVSGAKFTHSVAMETNPPSNSGVQEIFTRKESNEWADVAVIAYGTNDFTNLATIGNLNVSVQTYDQVDTFAKAINFAVMTLKAQNPDIKIIFLTPLKRSKANLVDPVYNSFSHMHLNDDFGGAIKSRAQAFSQKGYGKDIIAVDMWDCFTFAEITADSEYTADGLHPNDKGHKKMADYIMNYLNNMDKNDA